MIISETDEIILRPLLKNEADYGSSCDLSAEAFMYGGKEGCYAVVSKEGHHLIGAIYCPDNELTLRINPTERDNGYGSAALSLAFNHLFGVLGRKKITAVSNEDDITAKKTLLHVGMEIEYEKDGKIGWALTAERWELL